MPTYFGVVTQKLRWQLALHRVASRTAIQRPSAKLAFNDHCICSKLAPKAEASNSASRMSKNNSLVSWARSCTIFISWPRSEHSPSKCSNEGY